MKKQRLSRFFCVVFILFMARATYAQEIQIKGVVVDEEGQPLGGNSVSVTYQNQKRTPNLANGVFVFFIDKEFDKSLLKVQRRGYAIKEIKKNATNKEWRIVMWAGEEHTGVLLDEKGKPIKDTQVIFTAENHEEKSITNSVGKFYFYVPKNITLTNSSYFEVKNERISSENISIEKKESMNFVTLIFGKPQLKNIHQSKADTIKKEVKSKEKKLIVDEVAPKADTLKETEHHITFDKIIGQIQAERTYITAQNNHIKALVEQFTKPLKGGMPIDANQKKVILNNLLIIRDNLVENEQMFENFQEKNRLLINQLALLTAQNDSLEKVNLLAVKKLDSIIVIKEKMELSSLFAAKESQRAKLIFIIIAISLCLIAAIFFLFGKRERKKNKELAHKNQEIEQHQEKLKATNEVLENQNQEILKQNSIIEAQKLRAETFTYSLEREVDKQTYQLRAMLNKMTKQNEDLRQFSYIISHNIRSPIARLLGLMGLFNTKDMNDPFNLEVVERLHLSSQNLDMVVRDLTQIISIRNDLNREKEKIDIKVLIEAEKNMLKDDLENSQVILKEDLALDSYVFSIRSYVQSVVHNLLSNAIKYRARNRQLEIDIKTYTVGKYLCFSIQDNGIGMEINEFNKEKLFGLYQRMHDHVEGKGLGLYMVKTQVETLGGKIEIASKVNEGTTFVVYFPRGK